ncbi:chromosome partitioning protein [Micromonospora sp. GCM10011542]|uniref:chromosome partitioning protein n=1 Tax=Micromonospora sp. GCM10011542 TaxID=3317337 RepID=UPI00361BA935
MPAAPIAPGGVDLDLPFTLDAPVAPVPPAPNRAATGAGAPAAASAADGPAAGEPATGPADAGTPTAEAAPAAVSGIPGQDEPAAGAARAMADSPWAYPPQRPGGTSSPAGEEAAGDRSATGLPPIPAPPGPPQPGRQGSNLSGPDAGHPGAATAGSPDAAAAYPAAPGYPGSAGPGQGLAGSGPAQQPATPPPMPPGPGNSALPGTPGPEPHGSPASRGGPAAHGSPAQQGAPAQQGGPVPPPGPFPPSPGWYPPPWQQGTPGVPPVPQQSYPEPEARIPAAYPDAAWTPETTAAPTAEDFARRRQVRPADPVATMGVRAVVNKMGLLRLAPGRHEQELKRDIEMVRRNFGGLRQVTVVNPKGGAGKTVAILLLAMTFGQKRGGYVLAWDNNETQGTLGMRAQQDFHSRTVRDMLRDLGQFQGAHGRVGDLSQYVRSQGEGMFDVLASDESATGGEMLTAAAFAEIREVVSRFYKLIFVDTGNNVRAQNWQAAMDATDQLVVTMSARNDSAETAARMLDHLEQSGRQRLVRQAVTVVSMPPSRKEIDLPAIQEHFAARTRAVLLAPYERLIDSGEPIRYGGLSSATRDAWLKIAASVAEGL